MLCEKSFEINQDNENSAGELKEQVNSIILFNGMPLIPTRGMS